METNLFSRMLGRIGNPPENLEAIHAAHVKAWHDELAPAIKKIEPEIVAFDQLLLSIQLFVHAIEAACISDTTIARNLFELQCMGQITKNLRATIAESRDIGWSNLKLLVVGMEGLDQRKRDFLLREYKNRLTPGNITGRVRDCIGAICNQVEMLDRAYGSGGTEKPVSLTSQITADPQVAKIVAQYDPRFA